MKAAPPRRSDLTRQRIMAAARRAFAAYGYERATVRIVAAEARINPSMVIRYFGSKEGLFASAVEFDLRLPPLAETPASTWGKTLVRHFLERWADTASGGELRALLRAALTHAAARQRLVEIFEQQLTALVATLADTETAEQRAALIASQMLGLALTRYVLELPGAAKLDDELAIEQVGATIHTYLTAKL